MPKLIHPGEILVTEYFEPLEISQREFAEHLGISLQSVNQLVNGKRNVTPKMAWLLSMALGTTPEVWMEYQMDYDLANNKPPKKIRKIRK